MIKHDNVYGVNTKNKVGDITDPLLYLFSNK